LGAAREYIFGPGWQDRVNVILDECSWVVSLLGASEGLVWEYEQIVRHGMEDRLVLVIPPLTPLLIWYRWQTFQRIFPPARNIDVSQLHPLCAVFPKGAAPVVFCSKYQSETAYAVVLSMLLRRLKGPNPP
jgi:hypothetical protein